ncbi:MAG: GGDEF domain-containing response regulator [Planctomycetota bacterium]|jgi:two-component system chemotaxis response regulator CheY
MRILIAEDQSDTRRVLMKALERDGHEVLAACDGEEAWQLYRQHGIKAIITDWKMPRLDGPGLCARIRADQDDRDDPAYIILLTSVDRSEDLAHAIEEGANDFMRKPFDRFELKARLRNAERMLALQEELRRKREDAQRLAMTDALTGLRNRRAMLDALHLDEDRTRRERQHLGLVMVDLDHFKAVNDSYGHSAGDQVLRQAAQVLQACVRGGDYVGRWGGEEFLIALPGADIIQCAEVADRCRKLLASQRVRLDQGMALRLTSSFGATSAEGADRPDLFQLIEQADRALYWAKEAGRDRVKIYVGSVDSGPRPL